MEYRGQVPPHSGAAGNFPAEEIARTGRSRPKRPHRVAWTIYGLLVLVALVGVCFQIFRISTGQVKSAIPLENSQNQALTKSLETPTQKPIQPIDNPQVKKVMGLQPVQPAQLAGNDQRVTFRSLGGEIVCTMSTSLETAPPDLVPLAVNSQGAKAQGAGVICAGIHNQPARDQLGKCPHAGQLRTSIIGRWDRGQGLGACLEGTTPLYRDASEHRSNNTDGKRFTYQPLGLEQYTQIGKYVCGFAGEGVTCLDITNGKGFNFIDNVGYKFF